MRPVPVLAIFFVLGIVSSYYELFQKNIFLTFIILSLFVTCLFFINKNFTNLFIIVALLFFALGFFLTYNYLEKGKELIIFEGTEQEITATIERVDKYDFGNIYKLKNIVIDEKKYSSSISLIIYEPNLNLKYGDVIKFTGELKKAKEKRNPGEFDLNKYLMLQGIFLQAEVKEENVKLLENKGNFLLKLIYDWHEKIEKIISSNLKEREGAVFKAVVLGDRKGLSEDSKETFIELGLMHLLAISGLHIGFVIIFLNLLCKIFKVKKLGEFIFCSFSLILYAIITGLAPPVVRATIMAIIFYLGKLLNKESKIEESLALSAIIILLLNPLQLFTASFQLTFIATMGVIYLTPLLETLFENIYKKDSYISKTILVSFAAFIAVAPLSAYYFNRLSFIGPFVGVIITPLIAIVVILGIGVLFLSLFSQILTSSLLFFVGANIYFTLNIMDFFKNFLLKKEFFIGTPNLLSIFIMYGILCLIFLIFKYRENPKVILFFKKNKTIIYSSIFIFIIVVFLSSHFKTEKLQVTFLDVGQGDAIHIKTPSGKNILIDGGASTEYVDMGKKVVVPYLRHLGVSTLDVVFNSHSHNDHLGGLYTVIENYKPKLVVLPDKKNKEDYEDFINFLKKNRIKYHFAHKGEVLHLDKNLKIKVLHPLKDSELEVNDASLVLRLVYKKIAFLFTGDIEKEGLLYLKNNATLASQVLKAPHHGSDNSFDTTILKKIAPQVIAITVGEKNNFGHPGKKILEWAEQTGVNIYRTDLEGAIIIESDGEKINVKSMLPSY